MAGDFNATLDHSELRAVLARGYVDAADAAGAGLKPTWSGGGPLRLTIDHVLVDDRIRVVSYEVVHLHGSDHSAVIVKLRLP